MACDMPCRVWCACEMSVELLALRTAGASRRQQSVHEGRLALPAAHLGGLLPHERGVDRHGRGEDVEDGLLHDRVRVVEVDEEAVEGVVDRGAGEVLRRGGMERERSLRASGGKCIECLV